jgi:hypothetical protein
MAKRSRPTASSPDGPPERLPEPLEKVVVLYRTVRRIAAGVRARWGYLPAGLVVVVVVLALTWLAWPEIRERPGVRPAVMWLKQHLTSIPTCGAKNFCVAVADLQNDPDDRFGGESSMRSRICKLRSACMRARGRGRSRRRMQASR